MTDKDLSKYFDITKIRDIIGSPTRPLAEAVAEDIIEETRKLSEDRIRLEKMVSEKRKVRDGLEKLVWSYSVPAEGKTAVAGFSGGAMVGLFLGMFIPLPVGMIATSLICSFLAELVFSQKDAAGSLKSAFGAFLGFLFGSGIKIIACGVMLWYIIVYI